jgi:hypothetical protein
MQSVLREYSHIWLAGLGVALLSSAIVVIRWECPSERGDYIRNLWIATWLALPAALSVGAGLAIWLFRSGKED